MNQNKQMITKSGKRTWLHLDEMLKKLMVTIVGAKNGSEIGIMNEVLCKQIKNTVYK